MILFIRKGAEIRELFISWIFAISVYFLLPNINFIFLVLFTPKTCSHLSVNTLIITFDQLFPVIQLYWARSALTQTPSSCVVNSLCDAPFLTTNYFWYLTKRSFQSSLGCIGYSEFLCFCSRSPWKYKNIGRSMFLSWQERLGHDIFIMT